MSINLQKVLLKNDYALNFLSKSIRSFSVGSMCKASTLSYTVDKAPELHNLEAGPSTEVSCTKEEALNYYEKMQTVRRLETIAGNLYKDKQIRGFCHLYSGQVS
jgi:hypothetical protein